MRLRFFGIISIAVTVIELLLCFVGPMAFIRKPSLLLFPVFSHGLEEGEIEAVTGFIEKKIASTNSFSIVSQRLIVDYFLRTDPEYDGAPLEPVNYMEARDIARELELALEILQDAAIVGEMAYEVSGVLLE